MKYKCIAFLIFLSSCVRIYGIKRPKPYQTSHSSQELILDSTYQKSVYQLIANGERKDYLQPLQFWLYKNDTLVYSIINCYASGFQTFIGT